MLSLARKLPLIFRMLCIGLLFAFAACSCQVQAGVVSDADPIIPSAAPGTASPTPDAGSSGLDRLETVSFQEDKSMIASPERGWYRAYGTNDLWDMDKLRAQGITVVLLKANLKEYKDRPIGEAKLKEIRSAFDLAREFGLQVIFRAAYDFDGVKNCEPKSLSIITGHIAQLKDIFYMNEDILYCVQAGFLGPWGEWHSSLYGAVPSLAARKAVLFALMEAVPPSRSILIRRPMFIRDIYADQPGGSALAPATAFNQSYLARTGYHDDALLSTASESGTYTDPGFTREDELNWVDNQNRYVPFTAESNQLTARSDPDNAINELSKLHAQVVDAVYHPTVIAKWKATAYGGMSTYDYIAQRLGYRLILLDAAINSDLCNGGALHLRLRLKNDGFGNLINARPFEVVISNGEDTYTARVDDDPRGWCRESGVMIKDLYFSLPSGILPGQWSIYLNLPNASPALNTNPMYSVRFANNGVWMEEKGYNLLFSGVAIKHADDANAIDSFQQITRGEAELLCKTR